MGTAKHEDAPMTYRGHVKNGVVVLDGPARPPDGAAVTVGLLGQAQPAGTSRKAPTLYQRLKPFIGLTGHLPPDASANVDHYLYGAPKQK